MDVAERHSAVVDMLNEISDPDGYTIITGREWGQMEPGRRYIVVETADLRRIGVEACHPHVPGGRPVAVVTTSIRTAGAMEVPTRDALAARIREVAGAARSGNHFAVHGARRRLPTGWLG